MDRGLLTPSVFSGIGIVERKEAGLLVLSPANGRASRRVLFINGAGPRRHLTAEETWNRTKQGKMPSHRMWGAPELVRLGFEVAVADSLPDFYFGRRCLPHDLSYLKVVRSWLRKDDIVYCAHNVLYWLPLLKALGSVKCPIVSLLFAREALAWSRAHTGIIALNPVAADHARRLAPRAKIGKLAWGIDLGFYPRLKFAPETFLACGRSQRDDTTLSHAAARTTSIIQVILHNTESTIQWPANVRVFNAGINWENNLSYQDLLQRFYAFSAASLVIMKPDPAEITACGFTGALESMAVGRPVIFTRTGATPSELDVENAGCGIFVPPQDHVALAHAIDTLARDASEASAMGERGYRLCQDYYNINRFAADLKRFFDTF